MIEVVSISTVHLNVHVVLYLLYMYLLRRIPARTSAELRDLLVRMLRRNQEDRIEWEQVFVHPFIARTKPQYPNTRTPPPPTGPIAIPERERDNVTPTRVHPAGPNLHRVASGPAPSLAV